MGTFFFTPGCCCDTLSPCYITHDTFERLAGGYASGVEQMSILASGARFSYAIAGNDGGWYMQSGALYGSGAGSYLYPNVTNPEGTAHIMMGLRAYIPQSGDSLRFGFDFDGDLNNCSYVQYDFPTASSLHIKLYKVEGGTPRLLSAGIKTPYINQYVDNVYAISQGVRLYHHGTGGYQYPGTTAVFSTSLADTRMTDYLMAGITDMYSSPMINSDLVWLNSYSPYQKYQTLYCTGNLSYLCFKQGDTKMFGYLGKPIGAQSITNPIYYIEVPGVTGRYIYGINDLIHSTVIPRTAEVTWEGDRWRGWLPYTKCHAPKAEFYRPKLIGPIAISGETIKPGVFFGIGDTNNSIVMTGGIYFMRTMSPKNVTDGIELTGAITTPPTYIATGIELKPIINAPCLSIIETAVPAVYPAIDGAYNNSINQVPIPTSQNISLGYSLQPTGAAWGEQRYPNGPTCFYTSGVGDLVILDDAMQAQPLAGAFMVNMISGIAGSEIAIDFGYNLEGGEYITATALAMESGILYTLSSSTAGLLKSRYTFDYNDRGVYPGSIGGWGYDGFRIYAYGTGNKVMTLGMCVGPSQVSCGWSYARQYAVSVEHTVSQARLHRSTRVRVLSNPGNMVAIEVPSKDVVYKDATTLSEQSPFIGRAQIWRDVYPYVIQSVRYSNGTTLVRKSGELYYNELELHPSGTGYWYHDLGVGGPQPNYIGQGITNWNYYGIGQPLWNDRFGGPNAFDNTNQTNGSYFASSLTDNYTPRACGPCYGSCICGVMPDSVFITFNGASITPVDCNSGNMTEYWSTILAGEYELPRVVSNNPSPFPYVVMTGGPYYLAGKMGGIPNLYSSMNCHYMLRLEGAACTGYNIQAGVSTMASSLIIAFYIDIYNRPQFYVTTPVWRSGCEAAPTEETWQQYYGYWSPLVPDLCSSISYGYVPSYGDTISWYEMTHKTVQINNQSLFARYEAFHSQHTIFTGVGNPFNADGTPNSVATNWMITGTSPIDSYVAHNSTPFILADGYGCAKHFPLTMYVSNENTHGNPNVGSYAEVPSISNPYPAYPASSVCPAVTNTSLEYYYTPFPQRMNTSGNRTHHSEIWPPRIDTCYGGGCWIPNTSIPTTLYNTRSAGNQSNTSYPIGILRAGRLPSVTISL